MDARIVGITDAFDAMTSTRPYRRGMPITKALTIIEENLGRQFDRELGQRFIKLGQSRAVNHIVGHSDVGIPMQECVACGPTIVVRRNQKSGEHVYCRACGAQATLLREEGVIRLAPTGARGSADALQPEVDSVLIDDLVAESARVLEVQ